MNQGRRSVLGAVSVGTAAFAAGATGAALAAAAHFARKVLTPSVLPDSGVTVRAIEPSELSPTGERVWLSGPDSALEGNYSFIFDVQSRDSQSTAGHAKLGPVVERARRNDEDQVARNVIAVDRGRLRPGARGRVTGWWFTGPGELGERWEEAVLPFDDGEVLAWVIHPSEPVQGRWAVHVHGRGALREETLRGVPPLLRAGVTNIVIPYRNDPGAPAGLHGRYGLGLAEWRDVDAAVSWAGAQGATSVTIVGWSMGATASVLAAARGPRRSLIDGLVLDSPALDWPRLLRAQAQLAGAPTWVASLGARLLRSGAVRGAVPWTTGTDIDAISAASLAATLRVPVLIHASPEDSYVPWEGSLEVARLRPDLVQLRRARGEHVKIWNVDPEGWESATEHFVRGLGSRGIAPRVD